jgi:hypothetical protein
MTLRVPGSWRKPVLGVAGQVRETLSFNVWLAHQDNVVDHMDDSVICFDIGGNNC